MSKVQPSIERNALASLALTFVLVVVLTWMVVGTLNRITKNAEQLARANEIVDVVAKLKEGLVDMETGERGYIITGMEGYLDPHESGLSKVNVLRDKLVDLLRDDPSEQGSLAELSRRIERKISVSSSNVQARKQDFEMAREQVLGGKGKREMDALRVILDGMAGMRIGIRTELRNQRKEVMNELIRNIIVTVAVFISILGYLYWRFLQMIGLKHVAERHMQHIATHDVLTGLPNRRLMLELLEQSIHRCARYKSRMALFFMDLNGFKPINDKCGHDAGDEVLVQVAQRLSGLVRSSDCVARLGGDEFLVLAEDITGANEVDALMRKIIAVIEQPMILSSGVESSISTSIGVAHYPQDGLDTETLLRNADTAMYEAKRTRSAQIKQLMAEGAGT